MGRKEQAVAVVREKAMLLVGVLALQFLLAGFHIVSRAALNMGISKTVFIVYCNLSSLFLLAPFAYFLEKKDRPPLTFSLLVEFFLLALVGITANQGFYLLGLYHLSPTYASAIQQIIVTEEQYAGIVAVGNAIREAAGATLRDEGEGAPVHAQQPSAGNTVRRGVKLGRVAAAAILFSPLGSVGLNGLIHVNHLK